MGKEKFKILFVVGNKQFYGSAILKKGLFNLDEIFDKYKAWFEDHRYFFNEKKQSSKTLPDGKEIKIEWIAERKIDEYVKFHINVYIWVRRCNDIIAETRTGEKRKMQKGEISIRFKGFIEKDYRGKWKSETLRQFYDRFIIKNRLIKMEGKIWFETNDLINLTKKYCQMITPM